MDAICARRSIIGDDDKGKAPQSSPLVHISIDLSDKLVTLMFSGQIVAWS